MIESTRVEASRVWADRVGYSRAIRVGDRIEVAGTTGVLPDGTAVAPWDPYQQARAALAEIIAAVEKLGGTRQGVIRTRVFMTDISQWEQVGRAHHEVFGDVLPVSSFVGVKELLKPELVVEIEASAVAAGSQPGVGS